MAGTIGVLGVYDWFGSARTAQRRRAELRKVGIEFMSDLGPGVRVDVGRVLVAACDAWGAFSPSGGQHQRPAAGDDDGVLDVRGQRAVCGLDRPPIARSPNCARAR
jgi:hypothetical protein